MNDIVKNKYWMRKAIELASQNSGHPFAAIVVVDEEQRILGSGVNDSASHPLLHGEVVALQSCSGSDLKNDIGKTLYTTAEPCPMCIGAIIWSGIQTICYGTSIETLKRLGWPQIDITAADIALKSPREIMVIEQILETDCDLLFANAGK